MFSYYAPTSDVYNLNVENVLCTHFVVAILKLWTLLRAFVLNTIWQPECLSYIGSTIIFVTSQLELLLNKE